MAAPPPPLVATVEVGPDTDIAAAVRAAGGNPARARYDNGTLTVRDITQAALEAAVGAADPLFGARVRLKRAAGATLLAKQAAGMPWTGGATLQIDDASLNRITAASTGAQAGALPAGFAWRMADNSALPLDAAGMIALGTAALDYVYALRAQYWALVDAATNAADAAALAAIDPTAGWPVPPTPPA